ncbi:hypothetical protein WMZ97_20740 [Lentibacillus sp. N15]
MEILRILLPVVVGGIAVFVVLRMKYKYDNGTLGKKKSKNAQNLLDSLIPFGMMAGVRYRRCSNTDFPRCSE